MTVMLPQHLPRRLSRLARVIPGDPVRPAPDASRRSTDVTGRPVRRVRHEVRDGVAVIAFSAAASTALAMVLLLVVRVAG
ncbi:MAG: hypothetical protein ACJ72A_20680 [Nocardioidaceae bacterium]